MGNGIFLGALNLVSGTKYKVGRILYQVPDNYQPTDGPGVTVDSLPDPQPPAGMVVANTYVDTITKEVTYDYATPPKTQEQQLADMQAAVLNLQTAVATALGV